VRAEVEVRIGRNTVSVYAGSERIAMHKRSYLRKGSYVTDPGHMPDAHRDFVEWTGGRFLEWAAQKGDGTKGVIAAILASKPIEQQTYRSCHAAMSLGRRHGDAALEEACCRALALTGCVSYKTVKAMLAHTAGTGDGPGAAGNGFAYIRGAEYFDAQDKKG